MPLIRRLGLGIAVLLVLVACGDDSTSVDGGTSDGDAERFCELSAQLEEAASTSGTLEGFENYYNVEMALADEALRIVPADIRSDLEAILAQEVALLPLYEAVGYDATKLDAETFQAVLDEYPVPDGAGLRIGRWEDSNC